MEIWDIEKVLNLFGSGGRTRGDLSDYREFAEFLNDSTILGSECTYETVTEPPKTAPPSEMRRVFDTSSCGSGAEEHAFLKWNAWHWLRAQGEPRPLFEQWYCAGKCDVYAPNLGWVVECGDTDPMYATKSLRNPIVRAFVLFPFGQPNVCVIFRVTEEGRRLLLRATSVRLKLEQNQLVAGIA